MKLCQEIGCIERGFGCITRGFSVRMLCRKHYEEQIYDIMKIDEESDESGQPEEESWQPPLVFSESNDF